MDDQTRDSDRSPLDPGCVDAAFEALQNRTRRYVLYFLLEHDRVSVRDLATVVTGWVKADSGETGDRSDRDGTFADLQHRHVPLLVESGLIEYEGTTVSPSARFEAIRPFVERACTEETGS
ncbi:DUF7344 domain-containing protein [Halostagnicola kamekurae]|uniref:DUF7344 domain-containing protein n=1 Tax=Halostagnicola kamekurae TaxID=619731 RepID=A0A1I6SCZ7_9EURY|nr:hypothetical protein [Halostagnicola kamekurae]SFS74783.1 hypothetical protein SAMN04488556_2574 [Halostagnicola kamekurae]